MKKFLCIILLSATLASCTGNSSVGTTQDPATDPPKETEPAVERIELNITDGSYKVVYDIKDPDSMSIMTDMIDKINTASTPISTTVTKTITEGFRTLDAAKVAQ